MGDDDTRGVAVEAGVDGQHADQMLGLILDVARAPVPRHDDHWADVAQFAGDALGEQRLSAGFTRGALGARTPDNGVESLIRAGDVDLLNAGMITQVRALLRPAVDDAQVAAVDQRAERDLHEWAKVGVDGVHLADDDLILVEELVEDVERADAGLVASAEDERDLARMWPAVDARLVLTQVLFGDARLHPHIRRQPGE